MKLCSKCVKQFPDDANFCPVCASRLAAAPAEGAAVAGSDGDSLAARFEVGATVGGGRTGAVFDGNDKTTNQRVAIKVIAAPVTSAAGVSARIERETKQLERVVSPGIAKIVAWGKRGEAPWIASEFVAGAQTLATAINDRGPIGLAGAAEVIEVVGEALIEAAQVGVVHRDLAPKNILFAGDEIKVINFSVPVPTSEKSPGVAEFVAPEVVEGKPADQRSNIYSLGAIFYFALTGRPPFTGTTEAVHQGHLTGTPALPSTLVQVSNEVDAVVMRALERSPSKRFLTVRQFVDEALRVAKGTPVSAAALAANASGPNKRGALVQTLMGVRAHELSAPAPVATPASAPVAAVVAAPVVAPAQAPVPAVAVGNQTVAGMAAAPQPAATPAVATPAPAAAAAPSPWAPPATGAMAGAQAAVTAAAPAVAAAKTAAVAAPVVAAPVLASPVVGNAPAPKKPAEESKGKFRETMWFKKGDLDVAAAEAAAQERAKGKDAASDKVDSLPIDERYSDDGSITRGDKEKYSLRTGGTQMMQAVREPTAADSSVAKVSEDALIGEMKSGGKKMALIIGGVIAVLVVIAVIALS